MRNIQPLILTLSVLLVACTSGDNRLQDGIWRGELQVQDRQAPFLFEVKNTAADSSVITLINGEERVELTGISYSADTVIIPIEAYDAQIKATIQNNQLNGLFIKNYIEGDPGVAFHASFNPAARFKAAEKTTPVDINGKWDILFIDEQGDTAKNVGIFKSKDQIVTGSVLTNYGDLRFLEGQLTATGAELSAFSGLSPYLIGFDFTDDNHFEGTFYTTRGKTKLAGTRNEHAGLKDAYNLTRLKPGYDRLSFSLPNVKGESISINDERYQNKAVVISILGSWCPNCLDEMKYLSPWYKANKDRGVEIIGLAFERKDDFAYAQGTLSRLINKYDTSYEILFGGKVGEEASSKVLPEIEKITGYPTTIFIDKQGKVRKIHTGFNGPATGLFYDEFQRDFNALVDSLLAE